ncbi:hypothetical protein OHD62_33140 [Mesorhizobium sp. YC-39]|nr:MULTISPECIES: hypothetical protein [unclassified Mesorhizobium]MCV3211426.1 hypothetical protein [Mesorhizobium sp. YC-2]MCV3233216.1 hypothetical protein [Mesorhizobium sp. YC-39]
MIFALPVKCRIASTAVPIAEPVSFVHSGMKTSEKRYVSSQRRFHSQFNPHPPEISSGKPFASFLFCESVERMEDGVRNPPSEVGKLLMGYANVVVGRIPKILLAQRGHIAWKQEIDQLLLVAVGRSGLPTGASAITLPASSKRVGSLGKVKFGSTSA